MSYVSFPSNDNNPEPVKTTMEVLKPIIPLEASFEDIVFDTNDLRPIVPKEADFKE